MDRTYLLVAVAAALCGVAVWAAAPVAFDDAFISYRYAARLVAGDGLVFNPGERVEGYTNFLWVLLAAASLSLGIDPFLLTRALGLLAYCACVLAVVLTTLRLTDRQIGGWPLAIVPLLLVLVSSRDVPRLAGSGLETFFVSFTLLGMGLFFHYGPRSHRADFLGGVLGLVAVLTRMDAVLGLAASGLVTVLDTRRADLASSLGRRYGITALGLIAWTAWRLQYYGDVVPNSFYAKAAGSWRLSAGWSYLQAYATDSPFVVILVLLAGAGLALSWRTPWRNWQLFLCTFVALHTLYIVKVGGDFMYYRFAHEALPFLVSAGGLGMAATTHSSIIRVSLGLVCVAGSLTPRHMDTSEGMQSLWEMNRYAEIGSEVGRRMKAVLPPDTMIATTLAGTIPYYSELITIDQWGLNDRYVASLPAPGSFSRGHVKFAPTDYLRERHVNLVIDHPMICSCTRRCDEGRRRVYIRLGDDRCVRTSYLVERRDLTRHICGSVGDFVVSPGICE